jgi:hypothetical protein
LATTLAAAVASLTAASAPAAARPTIPHAAGHAVARGPRANAARLPMAFQRNDGQAGPAVRYLGQAQGVTVLFTSTGVTLGLARSAARPGAAAGSQARVTLAFQHASPRPRITGAGREPGTVNYFIGNNPSRWHTRIPAYARVVYRQLWPGVDATFTAVNGTLRYWFTLAPGASASEIRLAYTGARHLSVGTAGDLVITTPAAVLRDRAPASTQTVAGHREPVPSRYRLLGGTSFGFTVAAHAAGAALTIDPGLDYGTYLGGSVADSAFSIAHDAAGDLYVFGQTASPDFPTTPGAYQRKLSAKIGGTFFVTKFNPAGTALIYSTFVGGTQAQGLASGTLDSSGDAYVTGETFSTDFPTTPGAYRTTPYVAATQSVVFKLNPAGTGLLYSTYLAPDLISQGVVSREIAAVPDGSVIVIGATGADYAPTTPGAFETNYPGGTLAGYVARLNPTGSGLVYATYLGAPLTNQQALIGPYSGAPFCYPVGVAADAQGSAYTTGGCMAGFPTTPGAYSTTAGPAGGGLIVKLAPSGQRLDYATYWGHAVTAYKQWVKPVVYSGWPGGSGIVVDRSGDAYIGGGAPSGSIPVTAGAYQSDCTPNQPTLFWEHPDCGAVAEFNPDGSRLLYSSYFGGNHGASFFTGITDLAVDASGRMYAVGETSPGGLIPVTANAYAHSPGKFTFPFFVAVLGKGTLPYSSYFGGANPRCVSGFCGVAGGIELAQGPGSGSVYIGGDSTGRMPVSTGSFMPTYPGGANAAWAAKLGLPSLPPAG